MKTLLAVLMLLPTLLFAQEDRLSHLNKIIEIKVAGQEMQFVVTHSDRDNVYYRSTDYNGYETFLRINIDYRKKFSAQLLNDGVSYKLDTVESLEENKNYHVSVQDVGDQGRFLEKENFGYFYFPKLTGLVTTTEISFTSLFAKKYFDRIDAKGKYTSPIEYLACDGCEHGDQFFITSKFGDINVVFQDFGALYTPTCDEELHPWLSKLIDLKVPFTYYGSIDASSPDLWEGLNDHWMAAKGSLLIGSKNENVFSRFMQLLIFKAAEAAGENPLAAYDDVIEKGQFVDFKDNVLSFEYKGAVINFEL